MGLSQEEFWSLTNKAFWMKYRAFIRAENRMESALIRHALRTASYKKADRDAMVRQANALRQYPVKKWLQTP